MDFDDLIRLFYRHFLGRQVDMAGLNHWRAVLETGVPLEEVVTAIVESEEYLVKWGPPNLEDICSSAARESRMAMGRNPRVLDIGAHELDGNHVYSPLWNFGPVEVIGFEPQVDRARERMKAGSARAESQLIEIHPVALGDGSDATFYVNNVDSTSSLFPLNRRFTRKYDGLADLETVRTIQLPTTRLDDAQIRLPIDLLKIDVQGAELLVLENATTTLSQTSVVHCEVEFSEIYMGQPLFSSVDQLLRANGFCLIDLLPIHYSMAGTQEVKLRDTLLYADAVYFRDAEDQTTLLSQSLIASAVYKKTNLALHYLSLSRG